MAGVTSGLIGLGEEVTWEARHFGIRQRLSVKITRMERPSFFQDAMINGAFRSMTHDHVFEECEEGTRMIDRFEYRAPLGIFGRIAEWCFLTAYMRRFLIRRNRFLKELAESDAAHSYLVTNEEN